MSKIRETIELSEHICRSMIDEDYEEYDENENLGFEYVDTVTDYVDLEKSYSKIEIIIKRLSDNKFFNFYYIESVNQLLFENTNFPIKSVEKFPKTITTVIYE